jgi:tripartite-type tricarboxylate transporter receptor subunit TctC
MIKFFTKISILLILFSSQALASTIEVVIPFQVGGLSTLIGQTIINHLEPEFKKHNYKLVLIHKPGAGSIVGTSYVARTPKNQIRLLITTNALVTANIFNEVAEYTMQDFVTMGYIGRAPMIILTHSNSTFKTIDQLKLHCNSHKFTYGSAGVGSATHVATIIFLKNIGCNLDNAIHIPFNGLPTAYSNLIGGHIDFVTGFLSISTTHIQTGNLIPIVVLENNRHSELPQVPAVKEVTYKNYEFYNWFVILSNTSNNVIELDKVRQIINNGLKSQELTTLLQNIKLTDVNLPINNFFIQQEDARVRSLLFNE